MKVNDITQPAPPPTPCRPTSLTFFEAAGSLQRLPYKDTKYFTVVTVCNRPLAESAGVCMQENAVFCHAECRARLLKVLLYLLQEANELF